MTSLASDTHFQGRFSTHLAEDEPDPDEEDHVIELPSVSEWDVSRSVTQNKDRRDLKVHLTVIADCFNNY